MHNVFIAKLLTFCWFMLLRLSVLHWQVKDGIRVPTKYVQACELYFGMKIGDQGKSWAPRVVSVHVDRIGRYRYVVTDFQCSMPNPEYVESHSKMRMTANYIWWIFQNSRKLKISMTYPEIPSSVAPVPHPKNFVSRPTATDPESNTRKPDLVRYTRVYPYTILCLLYT